MSKKLKRFTLEDEHQQECCENVYADFESADWWLFDEDKYENVKELSKSIEIVEGSGFRIGGVFVPCYDSQNGYYSNNLRLIITDNKTQKKVSVNITSATKSDY